MTVSDHSLRQVRTCLRQGITAARAGDRAEARRCFEAAHQVEPENIVALLWLAWLAPTRRESLTRFCQVLDLDPANERAHAGIRWARRLPPSASERLPAAVVSLPKVTEDVPGRAPVFITPSGLLAGSLRFGWRLFAAAVLLVGLVFFVSLAMELGRVEGLSSLSAALPTGATFGVDYVKALVHGDIQAAGELGRALPKSLGLLAAAMILAVLLGLPLGAFAALRPASRFSEALLFSSMLGISTPSFFAAMLLIWFGVWLNRSTGAELLPPFGFGWDRHLILPALVLTARPTANMVRLGYNALVDVIGADYVRTARAKGLGPTVIFFRHVLRNVGVPLLTTLVVSLRFSLAALPIAEYIFNWPGVGMELLKAIQSQDTAMVITMILPLSILFVLANLLLETFYPLIDPRLRAGKAGAL